jgi:hypothetical protein
MGSAGSARNEIYRKERLRIRKRLLRGKVLCQLNGTVLYAYVNNNPLNKTDPTGMNACGTNNDSSCKSDRYHPGPKQGFEWAL